MDRDLEDKSQLLDESNYILRDVTDLPTKKTPWDKLFTNKFLSLLRKKRFSRNKFPADIPISDIKYNNLGLKQQNSFYLFYNQLAYTLTHSFVKSKIIKDSVNKFLFDLLITSLTKKLSYKNTDE